MSTLTTLEAFTGGADGADGGNPGYGSLVVDANGDLFGTTASGGAYNVGTVFELVNTGSGYTFETLASFNPTDTANGNTPFAGLTMDANGNLFGVTQLGGAGYGTAFELANTGTGYSTTIQTLASFTGASGAAPGANPMGALLADANGDLFGTTESGGAGYGTVFELVNTGSGYTFESLVSFSATTGASYPNGSSPTGPLIADANGDLFGTTQSGGSSGDGTVFELVNTGSGYTLNVLAEFNGSNGSFLYAGLIADAQGDLFGTTYGGGSGGLGTVFELVNTGSGYAQPVAIAAFNDYGSTGGYLIGGLTIDAQGDIFGTAMGGGANGFGTVFELVHSGSGYSSPQLLYSFGGADGAFPEGALTLDAQGNLYGTTNGGGGPGGSGSGTVFEIGSAAPGAEQANLALNVNGGLGNPIGAAGEGDVAFTVTGLQAGDTGVVTFTDSANHTVTVDVVGGQTHYTADFSTLSDGAISASLQVATNSQGASFTPVAGNAVTLDTVAPAQPDAPTDAAIVDGVVNAAGDIASQTIGGTAEAGAAVAIYDNGHQVGSVIADGSGAWSYQVGHLADGAHSYAVTATDAAGNVSAMSAALSFTVESGAPPQPAAPSDASASNGYVNAAHDTAAQTIGGTTEAGATVAIYDNGTQVATVVADTSGAWSYQVGALIGGTSHSYAVTATNAAGNTSAMSEALSFKVDIAAPGQPAAPSDASVSNGYVNAVHDTAGQTLGGTAEAGASVAIYDNGTQVATVTADGSGAWSYQVGHLADGSAHSYAVTATDAAGNTSALSAALGFTVDTSAPAQPGAPSDASVANGYVNAVHDTAGQTIGGTAEAGASVAIYDNGTQVATVVANGAGAWSYQVGHLADGSAHSYAVTATDAAGNTSAMGAALNFTVDASAPAQPGAPADGAVVNGYVNAVHDTAAQTIGGTAEAGASVAIYDNGTQVATVVANGAGAWSYQVGHLADGSAHSYAVTATDAAGNTSALSAALSFTVDTNAPAQPGAPADGSVVNGYVNAVHDTAGQTIGGTAEAGASVAIYDNGTQVATVVANGAGAWSYQVGHLADGPTHSYAVTATDAAGNTSALSTALNFTVDTSAPAQPGAPADGAVVNGYVNAVHDTAAQTIGGTAEAGASVAIYDNGSLVTTVAANGAGAWSYQVGTLADGSAHSYAVTATDAAGNTSAMGAALGFTVDASAPAAPFALSDAAVSGGYVNAAHDTAGQALTGTAEHGSLITVWDNGVKLGFTTANALTGAWSFNLGVLADGAQSLTATATDAAGNTGIASAALTFTVDTLPPASAVGQVTVGSDGVATVSGSAEAGSSVALYDGGALVGVVTVGTGGTWSYPVGVLAGGSAHSYAVTATDSAGNISALSQALGYTAPSAPGGPSNPPAQPAAPTDAAVHNGYVNAAADTAGQTIGGTTEAGALVTIYDHGTQVRTVTANASGAWSWQVGVLADGSSHSYTVTAANAGGVSPMSGALGFTVDTTPPVPVVDNVVSAAKGQNTVTGTSEAGSTVTLFDGGQQVGMTTAGADGTWSVTLKLNGGAIHNFTETAVDLAGNSGASTGPAYWASPGNKALVGAAGDDVFIGAKGDTLTGGGGHDHFVFNTGFGAQTVTDFTSGTDQLWFDHTLFASASQVLAHAQQSGGNTVITDTAGDQVVLQGVVLTALHTGDFLLF